MSAFLQQLRQRKITQWTLAYLAGAWVFLEVLGFVADHFGWHAVIVQGATITLGMGVPVVMVLAWFHGEKGRQRLGRLEGLLLGVLSLVTVAFLFQLPLTSPTVEINPSSPDPESGRSLAVLPFLNAADDPEQQYFSDGITEELTNELARLPGLRVAARTSSFQFAGSREGLELADIARQLGVTALVEGSVRRVGDTVRVTAKLINAEDGFQMWSERFDRKMADIFAIQDEIASAIATALHVQLVLDGSIEPSVPRTANIDAYNLYLLGRYHFEKRTVFELQQAQRYFEDAIERDPLYAPAYNGLVDATMLQSAGGFGDIPVEQNIAFALPLINRSLKLDPDLADTHASLGLLRLMERDLRASEAALLHAIELNPNLSRAHNWLYITYEWMSAHRKAFESLQRAFTLDPLSPIVNSNMAAEWWIRGENAEALLAAQRAIQIAPDGPLGYRRYARIKRTSGELAEAVEWYRKSLEVTPGGLNSELELGSLLVDMGYFEEAESLLGDWSYIAYLAENRIEDALSVVHAVLDEHPEDFRLIAATARAESRAGNFDQARRLLEPLAEGHDPGTGPLFRPSGIHFWDPQIAAVDLVVALLEEGDKLAGLELLSEVRKYFDAKKAEGLDYAMLNYQQARVLALEGHHGEALRVLRNVIAAGWRFWYLANDPAFKSMWDNLEFRSIVSDKDMLVEQERVSLASR